MACGNFGTTELLLVFMLLLLLFGAKKLPALARSIGSGINEFKKGLNSTNSEIDETEFDPSTETKKGKNKPGSNRKGRPKKS